MCQVHETYISLTYKPISQCEITVQHYSYYSLQHILVEESYSQSGSLVDLDQHQNFLGSNTKNLGFVEAMLN